MADYNTIATTEGLEQQEQAPESTNVDEAFREYQQALIVTFDHTRAGRLVDASRTLLEISEWLVGNARELGMCVLAPKVLLALTTPESEFKEGYGMKLIAYSRCLAR